MLNKGVVLGKVAEGTLQQSQNDAVDEVDRLPGPLPACSLGGLQSDEDRVGLREEPNMAFLELQQLGSTKEHRETNEEPRG